MLGLAFLRLPWWATAAAGIFVLVTHALFVDDALERLHRAGVDAVWSSDSIPHPSNRFELGSLLARALRRVVGERP